jgi:hypothetical protein
MDTCENLDKNLAKTLSLEMEEQNEPSQNKENLYRYKEEESKPPKGNGKAMSNQFLVKSNTQHVLGDCTVHSQEAKWYWN